MWRVEGLLSAAAMSRLVGTSESAVKDEIRDDVRRLLQASTLSRREGQAPRTQESIAEEVLGLETMRICARLKAEARERCKLVQAEYRALVSAYCSPRPLAWPAVERPRLAPLRHANPVLCCCAGAHRPARLVQRRED